MAAIDARLTGDTPQSPDPVFRARGAQFGLNPSLVPFHLYVSPRSTARYGVGESAVREGREPHLSQSNHDFRFLPSKACQEALRCADGSPVVPARVNLFYSPVG